MTDNRHISPNLYSSEKYVPVTGTTYAVTAADMGKTLLCSSGSATTVTLPDTNQSPSAGDTAFVNDLPLGFNVDIVQLGAGAVTVAAASGATVNGITTKKTLGQYARVHVEKYAETSGHAIYGVSGNTALS